MTTAIQLEKKVKQVKSLEQAATLSKKLFHHRKEVKKLAKKAQSFVLQRIIKRIKALKVKCTHVTTIPAGAEGMATKAEDNVDHSATQVPEHVRVNWERELERLTQELHTAKTMSLDTIADLFMRQHIASFTLADQEKLETPTSPLKKGTMKGLSLEQRNQLLALYDDMTAQQSLPQNGATSSVTNLPPLEEKIQNRLLQHKALMGYKLPMEEELGAIVTGTLRHVKARIQKFKASVLKRKRPNPFPPVASNPASDSENDEEGDGWDRMDEEGSDDEVDTRPVKKNRPGQQARRALWEKKYGDQAKHVIIQKTVKPALSGPNKVMPASRPTSADAAQRKGGEKINSGSTALEVDPSLHPSWAAKKAAKPIIQAFQGSKITFGEDAVGGFGSGPLNKPKSSGNKVISKSSLASMPATAEQLHPSWEAKRKAKEAQEQLMKSAKPTKIVFD